ncbi:MAG: hypothetical protein IPH81_18440 [Candidatus Microthrix sp.]|nr:hypothetical protein [Candidatus Microthrix sp.]
MSRLLSRSAWRSRLESVAARVLALLGEWSRRMAGIPGLRPVAATLGTLLVVFVSWRAWQGAEFGDVSVLALMAVGVLTVPLLLAADAAEFALQGAMVGVHLPAVESVRQVSRANVANLLPLPGGPVLRQRVLSTRGAGQRSAARAQLITGIWWLACGLTVSGLALMAAADRWWIGGLALLGGLGFGGIGWTVRPRAATAWPAGFARDGRAGEGGDRSDSVWIVALLLGAELRWLGALSTAFSTPAAAALGIFPSGIGAREALVGGVAELIGASAALLFLAATIERVVATVAMLPVLVWAMWGEAEAAACEARLEHE